MRRRALLALLVFLPACGAFRIPPTAGGTIIDWCATFQRAESIIRPMLPALATVTASNPAWSAAFLAATSALDQAAGAINAACEAKAAGARVVPAEIALEVARGTGALLDLLNLREQVAAAASAEVVRSRYAQARAFSGPADGERVYRKDARGRYVAVEEEPRSLRAPVAAVAGPDTSRLRRDLFAVHAEASQHLAKQPAGNTIRVYAD